MNDTDTTVKPVPHSRKPLHCNFCGKSQHEISKMVAGATAFICDECLNLCAEIMTDEKPDFAKMLIVGIARVKLVNPTLKQKAVPPDDPAFIEKLKELVLVIDPEFKIPEH